VLANDLLPLHYNEDYLLEAIKDPNEKEAFKTLGLLAFWLTIQHQKAISPEKKRLSLLKTLF